MLNKTANNCCKRFIDIAISLTGLFVLMPVFITVVFLKYLEGEKIFFLQNRVGKGEKYFKVFKFRTMNDSQAVSKPLDRALRITALDELPQLINIISGDMSIVGPRPLIPQELIDEAAVTARCAVRPGLTGPAQILLDKAAPVREKIKLDNWYIENQNLVLDIKMILISLAFTILRRWEKERQIDRMWFEKTSRVFMAALILFGANTI